MSGVLAVAPAGCPFLTRHDGTLIAADAAAAVAVLTSPVAVPPFTLARRASSRLPAAPAQRLHPSTIDIPAALDALTAELRCQFARCQPEQAVPTLDLLGPAVALSTVTAVLPHAAHQLRHDLAGAVLHWIDQLAPLIRGGRTPARLSAGARRESAARRDVTALLRSAAPTHPLPVAALAAGVQVPTAAGAWLLDLLSRHPDVASQVRAGQPGWARAVTWETLRLYPPTWQIPRLITADTTLAGHPTRLGSRILVSPFRLGRDPSLYPPTGDGDPGFAPARWLTSDTPPGRWLPFGAGPRACPGRRLALAQLDCIAELTARTVTLAPTTSEPDMDTSRGLSPAHPFVQVMRNRDGRAR